MACARIQQHRLFLAAPVLLLLLLLLAVLAQPCSCRPLRPLDSNNSMKAATDVILLPLPAETAAAAGGGAARAPSSVPREEHEHQQQLAAGRYQWLLNKKPRARAQPSAPSKRTN